MISFLSGQFDFLYFLCGFFCLLVSVVYFLKYYYFNRRSLHRAIALLSLLAAIGAGTGVFSWHATGTTTSHALLLIFVAAVTGGLAMGSWLRFLSRCTHEKTRRPFSGMIEALLIMIVLAGGWVYVNTANTAVEPQARVEAIAVVFLLALVMCSVLLWRFRDKEAAFQLREGESRYKSLFNEMITGVAVHSLVRDAKGVPFDYRFLEVNPAFERLTGLRAADIIGRTAREILPGIEPEWIDRYVRVTLTGQSEQFQLYSSPLAKFFDVRAFGAGPDRFAVVFEDITDRKRTMDELAGMMIRLRHQQKNLMAIANINGTDLKAVVAKITPLAAAGIEADRVSLWLGSREDGRLICLDLFDAREGWHSQGMILMVDKYPRYFHALETGRVIDAGDACHDPRTEELLEDHLKPLGIGARIDAVVRMSGHMVAVISCEQAGSARTWRPDEVRFVTEVAEQIEQVFLGVENRRHELALQEKTVDLERERINLQAIFDAVHVGMFIVNKDGAVRRANSAAAQFVGKDIPMLLGEQPGSALCCLHAHDVPAGCGHAPACSECPLRRTFLRVMVTGESLSGLEIRKELLLGGEVRVLWLELTASPIILDGERHVLLALSDVSARRRTEETLRDAKEAAEAADKVKSEFLANMSHEVRTPMNAILGFAQLLQRTPLNEKQLNYVETIMSSGTLLMQIINDVLDLSRMAAGKIALENIEFDLRPLLNDIIKRIHPQGQAEGLRFVQDVAAEVPDALIGDPSRLRQVLMNVLGNAVKFTAQGAITLRVRRMLWEVPGRIKLAIEVEDTGIGIAPEKLQKIFEPFTQADMSTTRPYGGTGLGLSICRSIVQAMGGRISMVSDPGKGSLVTFTAVFSLAISGEAGLPAEPEPGQAPADLKGVRILVVEDNLPNRELIKEILSVMQCQAVFARDGKEGVELLRAKDFDICLMDVQMPVMGGEEATRIIRGTISRTLPIIALTGVAMPGDRQRLLTSGMTDYLSKPVSLDQLREKIALYVPGKTKG